MQEICQSGSEGGAKSYFVPTPIDAESPRPGGTVEVIVSPRDICRRNGVHAALETLTPPMHLGMIPFCLAIPPKNGQSRSLSSGFNIGVRSWC